MTPRFAANRAAALFLAAILLVSCKKRVCKEWGPMELPEGSAIDTCHSFEVHGKTTAKRADFESMFERAGFARGRSLDATLQGSRSWVVFAKPDDAKRHKMSAHEIDGEFMISTTERTTAHRDWLPESTWSRLPLVGADREALVAKLAIAADLLAKDPKAPPTCSDAALAADPTLAKRTTALLVSAEALADAKGKPTDRVVNRIPRARAGSDLESEYLTTLLGERELLDTLAAMRIVPAIRLTSYRSPSLVLEVPKDNPGLQFHDGNAKFDVAVIDLVERRVLCRSKTEAGNSKSALLSELTRDLALNIDRAAFAELSKMNPAFQPLPPE